MTTFTDAEKEIPDFLKENPKIWTWNYKNAWNGPSLRALHIHNLLKNFLDETSLNSSNDNNDPLWWTPGPV